MPSGKIELTQIPRLEGAPASGRTVRIAGAGPSGLAAAIVLARQGFAVELHEAKSGVALRWKRGLQVIENFTEKEDVLYGFRQAGIDVNFYTRPVHRLTLWDRARTSRTFESGLPLGYYVKRGPGEGTLDRGLLEQAQAAGARVVFDSFKAPGEDVDITATGPRRVDGIGKEVTFDTDLADRMTVILDPELAPGGYAYLFVVDGKATLGMAVLHRFKKVDPYYEKTVERFRELERVRIENPEVSYSYANFFVRPREASKEVRTGEAAGLQDYLFGFGIRFAVESGVFAARSVAEGVSYADLSRRRFEAKQEMSLLNRFLYETFGSWVPRLFILLGSRSSSFRDYLRGWYRGHPLKSLGLGLVYAAWRKRDLNGTRPGRRPDGGGLGAIETSEGGALQYFETNPNPSPRDDVR